MKTTARLRSFLAIAGSAVLTISYAQAATLYWDVDGTTAGFGTVVGGWNTTNNFWNTDVTGGNGGSLTNTTTAADDLIFSPATVNTGSITVTGTQNASSITFAANIGPTATITGGTAIVIGGTGATSGIFQQSSGANTIATALTLKSDISAFNFSNSSTGLLTIGAVTGAATSGTQTITVGSSNNGGITLGGIIGNGAGGGKVALNINSSGAGITTLSGASTFTGGVTMTAGTASFTSTGLGSASTANKITFNGNSTLQWGAATTTDLSARLIINTGFTATLDTGANNVTFASILGLETNSKGTLNKTGSGILTLGNTVNQFAGNIVISGGRVALGGQYSMWQSAYDTTGSTGVIGLNVTGQATPWLGGLAGSVNLATGVTGYGSVTTLTLNPQTGSSVSYGGVIANGAANMALSKTGHGTQTLTGTNSYSGATTVWAGTLALGGASGSTLNSAFTVRGGTVELDNSGGAFINRLADATALSLGSLTLKSYNGAGAQTETVGATSFAVGGKVTINNGTTGGDQTTFAMGAVTRSVGAAIDFVGTNGTLGSGANSPNVTSTGAFPSIQNNILPWATVGGTQWAENNASSVRAFSGSFTTLAAATNTTQAQQTGAANLGGALNTNSLNVISDGSSNILALGGNTISFGSTNVAGTLGAILKSGTNPYTISGGTIHVGSGGAGTELITHVDGGALTISSNLNTAIVNIAKGGTGDLIFSGTRAGTMGGNISIAGGQLEFQGASTTLSGVITGLGGLTVNLNAGQILTLTNNSNSYAGPTIIRGGYVNSNNFGAQGMPGGLQQIPSTNTSQIMSNLILEGGVFVPSYVFNKDLGAGPGQVQILAGTSGFVQNAFSGGATQYVLDGGRELVWGSTYFNPTVFVNTTNGNLTLNLANGFDLNGSTRTMLVGDATYTGAGAVSQLGGAIRTSSGTAGFTKTGIGELLLTGASTYNGATTVSAGTLSFQGNANVASANPLGQSSAAAANLLLANGTTLLYNGAAASTDRAFTIDGTANGHGVSLNASGSAAINFSNTASPAYGTVDQTRTLTLTGTNTNNNILAANIANNGTGAVSVTKTGAGLWVLSGTTSSYTGPTTISAGTLSVSAVNNLGDATSNLVFNGGTLQPNTVGLPNFSTIGHTVVFNFGQTVGLDITSGTFTADQVLNQGNGGLTKSGAGTLALNQANTYVGNTTISVGTLQLGSGAAGGSLNIGSAINVASGATFAINQSDTVTQGIDFGRIGGAGSLSKLGSNTLVLNAPTYHTGTTTVSAGTLSLTNNLALQNSALVTTGVGTVSLGSGITTPTFGGLSGASGALATVISSGYDGITNLTLKPESGSVTYDGVIANNAANLSLTKTGAGTQVFQGANLYEGATYLNGGTLTLSGAGSILGTSGITFNNGSLTLTNTAAETGSGRINANAITSNGGTLTYNNISGTNVYAETIGSVALTSGQLNIVQAVNQTGAGSQTLTLGGLTHPGTTSAVTFSSAGTRTTKNMIVVTGATATAADAIIGPWATIGTAANVQTDYAIYNGSAQVVERNIGATAQTTWSTDYTSGTGTLNNTTGGADTLTAGRIINSLRSTNAGSTFTLVDSTDTFTITAHGYLLDDPIVFHGAGSVPGTTFGTVYYARDITANTFKLAATPGGGVVNLTSVQTGAGTNFASKGVLNLGANNLGTLGILGGGTGTLAITASGIGVVTLPTTTADSLHVTAGAGAVAIHAPIKDNTASGDLTLVKNGSGNLYLTSTTSDYSGGTVINAGTLNYTSDASLGLAGTRNITFGGSATLNYPNGSSLGTLTVNTGATATIPGGGLTFTSASGAGTLYYRPVVTNQTLNIGNASAFTGDLRVDTGFNTNAHPVLRFSSLGDAVGSKIQFGGTNGDSNQQVNVQFIGTAPLVFNNRVLEILLPPSSNGPRYNKVNSSSVSPVNTWTINTNLSMLSTASRELELTGTNTGENTFAGVIGNGLGTIGLTKTDTGRWIVSGSNPYTGVTTITGGTLQITSIANGGAVSSIGASGSGAGNLILNGGALRYTGAAVSTDRLFSLQATSTIDASGTGALNFTNTGSMGFNGGTAAKTLTLTGANTGNNTIAAVIGDLTAATTLVKNGIGTWVLGGVTNSFTGTTTLNAGRLVLDYAASNTTKLANGAALTLGGGTLELSGGNHTEIVASTTLTNNTGSRITQTNSGTSVLQLGTISRSNGGSTLSFSADNIATTNNTNVNGILGPGYTVGSHWAVNFTNGANGQIRALTTYTTTVPTITGVNTANYQLTGSQNQTGTTVGNTLRIVSDANDQILNLSTFNFDLNSTNGVMGAILYAGGANDNYTINGSGAIKAATGNNHLGVNVFTGTLTVNALVGAGSGTVTKWGAGTLVIGSNNSGLSGAHYVQEGTLRLANNGATGTTAGGIIVSNGAALELSNSVAIGAEPLTISGYGISNAGALRNVAGNTSSYAGAITLNTATSVGGARINSDASGTLTLSGGVVTSLFNDVTFGGAGNTTVSTVAISGAGGLVKDSAGTTTLSATNTYTGSTTVSAGKLTIASTGLINTTSGVSIGAGNFNYNSSTALSQPVSFSSTGGTLSGTGTITPAVTVTSGNTLAPGASAGTLGLGGGLTIAAGGIFEWENNTINTLGSAGTNWDVANVSSGSTTISNTASTGSKIKLMFTNAATSFSDSFWNSNQSWNFITGGVTAGNLFDTSNITVFINAVQQGVSNAISGEGEFSTLVSGSNLQLVWTASAGTPYETWINGYPSIVAPNKDPDDDPDFDGVTNLAEFAFGTDPTSGSSGPNALVYGASVTTPGQPVQTFTITGPTTVDFNAVFGRRTTYVADGLTYTVQFSANNVDWETSAATPVQVATPTLGIEAVKVPYPLFISTPSVQKPTFFRVTVSMP